MAFNVCDAKRIKYSMVIGKNVIEPITDNAAIKKKLLMLPLLDTSNI